MARFAAFAGYQRPFSCMLRCLSQITIFDLLEETHRKDEEMESLQDRVNALETSTRVALDHLESVPEKLSLLEDFKGFRKEGKIGRVPAVYPTELTEDIQNTEFTESLFSSAGMTPSTESKASKQIAVGTAEPCWQLAPLMFSLMSEGSEASNTTALLLDDRDFAESSHAHGLDQSSCWQDHSRFLSSPRFSHLNSFTQRTVAPDSPSIKEDAPSLLMDGRSPQPRKEEYESKNSKIIMKDAE
ncbi:hypothetical protein Celaphus_00005934, partial [Cervus elaphus hippelaphus]